MAAPAAQISSFAELGAKVIRLQLSLAEKTPDDAMRDTSALGYCFGVFDAMGRRAHLDGNTDGLTLIAVGFSLLAGRDVGSKYLARALDLQTDRAFFNGNYEGGSEIYEWLERSDYKPLALVNHFALGPPESRTA